MADETQVETVEPVEVEDEEDDGFDAWVAGVEATAAAEDAADGDELADVDAPVPVDYRRMSAEDFEKVMSDPDRFGEEDDEDEDYEPSLGSYAEALAPQPVNLLTLSPAEYDAHLAALMALGMES